MIAAELIKKIRKIEIRTRGLTQQVFAGEYHSAFKGQGMILSEVREYQYGDPIRNIDWNVTARFNKPFIKVFEEERELTVMLLVDVSGSNDFGTFRFKRDFMTELAAVLAFSALQNNDKTGLILFSDKVEKFIPPKKGKKHIMRIILEILNFQPDQRGTNIPGALQYLTHIIKKRATVFLISDFILPDEKQIDSVKDTFRLVNKKHDLVALQVSDPGEKNLPGIGMVKLHDPETNKSIWLDSGNRNFKKWMQDYWIRYQKMLEDSFVKSGIDYASLSTHEDYVTPLVQLFKKRGRR